MFDLLHQVWDDVRLPWGPDVYDLSLQYHAGESVAEVVLDILEDP